MAFARNLRAQESWKLNGLQTTWAQFCGCFLYATHCSVRKSAATGDLRRGTLILRIDAMQGNPA